MRRTNLAVLLLAIASFGLLASCDQGEGGSDGRATIRFWHFWSEPGQRAVLQELVKRFEDSTNTVVELTELSWNDGKAKLQAAFNSGMPPDVIELGSDWVAQFSSAGVLLSLPLDSTSVGRFVPYAMPPAMWNGRLYAYPWTIDTRVMYVNRGLLDKAGWKRPVVSMDDLLEASEAVAAIGAYGYGANGADAHRLYKKILPFYWTYEQGIATRKGSPFHDMIDEKGNVTFDSDAWKQAFDMYAKLARTGYIETQRQLDAAFIQGKIAFWNSGSWLIPRIRDAKGLQAEAILMPGVNGMPGQSFAGGEYLAVSAATKNSQRARELVQFLTSSMAALEMCKRIPEAGFPADKRTYQDTSLLNDPYKATFAQQLDHARMTPVHAQWLDLEHILEDALVKVLLGEAEIEDALLSAQEEAEIITRQVPLKNQQQGS